MVNEYIGKYRIKITHRERTRITRNMKIPDVQVMLEKKIFIQREYDKVVRI